MVLLQDQSGTENPSEPPKSTKSTQEGSGTKSSSTPISKSSKTTSEETTSPSRSMSMAEFRAHNEAQKQEIAGRVALALTQPEALAARQVKAGAEMGATAAAALLFAGLAVVLAKWEHKIKKSDPNWHGKNATGIATVGMALLALACIAGIVFCARIPHNASVILHPEGVVLNEVHSHWW